MRTKKIIPKLLVLMLITIMMVPAMTMETFAASRVEITGPDQVSAGDKFTVTIEFAGDDLAAVEGQVGYDATKLEYVSGAKDGGEGYLILDKDGGDGTVTFDITFKAIKGGNTGIDISSSLLSDSQHNQLDDCADTKVIEISGAGADDEGYVVDETENVQQSGIISLLGNTWLLLGLAAAVLIIIIIIIIVISKKKTGRRQ